MVLKWKDGVWNIDDEGFYIRGDSENGYELCILESILGDDLEYHLEVNCYYSSYNFEDLLTWYSENLLD